MKKILILGATKDQIPVIVRAKERGFFVIVCTYNSEESGIGLADEFHHISTTDREAVLSLAKKRDVDIVLAYASDAAGPTAAYVSEEMGLPGNPYDTVKMMTDKYLFRSFLRENESFTPEFIKFTESEIHSDIAVDLEFPLIIKPVDSSGGRGVKRVEKSEDLLTAAQEALSYSFSRTIIAEEIVETEFPQVHGNGFVVNGELVFSNLGDHMFRASCGTVPVATLWPGSLPEHYIRQIEEEVSRVIKKSGFLMGPVNIEARITKDKTVSIIELAPRSAGNFVSELILNGTGVDIVGNYLSLLEGKSVNIRSSKSECVAYYLLHSEKRGIFCTLDIDLSIQKYISDINMYVGKGDQVDSYQHMNNSIGIVLFKFDQIGDMQRVMKNMPDYLNIVVE